MRKNRQLFLLMLPILILAMCVTNVNANVDRSMGGAFLTPSPVKTPTFRASSTYYPPLPTYAPLPTEIGEIPRMFIPLIVKSLPW